MGLTGNRKKNGNYRLETLSRQKMPEHMAAPTPARAGRSRAVFYSIVAVALLCGAYWWLDMAPEKRGILRDAAAETVNDALSGTPLAGAGDMLRQSPLLPPPNVTTPVTEAGTLAGRSVTGTIASPVDIGAQASRQPIFPGEAAGGAPKPLTPGMAGGADGATFSQEYMPPAQEDSTVRSTYLTDVAQWLADRYRPGPRGGTLAVDARNVNQLCGGELAGRAKGGRSALLRYAFQPTMIQALYNLYINQFMADLDAAAKKRGFDAAQNRDFHEAIAGRVTLVANALDSIMAVPDLGKKLEQIDAASQKAVDINAQLTTAVSELDELRSARAPERQISATQMRVEGITARYRRAMDEHASAQRALANAIRKDAGLDEDSLLYMAAWVERRMAGNANAAASLRGMSGVLRDLARRCSSAKPGA